MKRLVIHIDRIVLGGVASGDRHAFAQGLRQALVTELSEPETGLAWTRQRDAAQIGAGLLQVPHAIGPADLGAGIARQIAGSVKR